jgi:hypothetical protein
MSRNIERHFLTIDRIQIEVGRDDCFAFATTYFLSGQQYEKDVADEEYSQRGTSSSNTTAPRFAFAQ